MRVPDAQSREALVGKILLWGEILAIMTFLLFRVYVSFNTVSPVMSRTIVPEVQPDRITETLRLNRGDFSIFRYSPGQTEFMAHPKAVIIFGSGDGGFDGWEDRVCKALQADGYELIGFDCNSYAKSDYDLNTLQEDMNIIAQNSLCHYKNPSPPLILGGWSMGAEQALAAAGGPHPPVGLTGLLLISPGNRGRYGLRDADRWNVPPTGLGTFALEDFARSLGKVRVAQWNGNLDLLGSKTWLDSLTVTHKAYGFPWGLHDYDGASDKFLKLLKKSVAWILSSSESASKAQAVKKD